MTNEEKNLNKLSKLLSLMESDGLTEEKFIKHFQVVIELIKKLQLANKDWMDSLDTKYSDVVESIKANYGQDMTQIKSELYNDLSGKLNALKGQIDTKLALLKDGQDGKDADEERVIETACEKAVEMVTPLIPTIEQVELDLPKLGKPIRDALELLQGDERLDKSAIKGLEELIEELRIEIRRKNDFSQIVGGSGGGKMVKSYDLSGSLNGVLKTFSLPSFRYIISVHLSSFPNIMRPTTDYTVSGNTITFTSQIDAGSSLATGQTLIIVYSE